MEVVDWAHSILQGGSITDKLMQPDCLSYSKLSREKAVDLPQRTSDLRLNATAHSRAKIGDLETDRGRAAIFHFFANHELLAIELFAHAIAKFHHDLPKPLLASFAQNIKEEQKHLRLYLKQIEKGGMAFGELPLNSFFWRCISKCKSPSEFLASLSLTFEQANLDFSLFYIQEFQNVSDQDSVDILQEVYRDEIGHVAIGCKWLKSFKPTNVSLWEYYNNSLLPPLTAARAKGSVFDRCSRAKAGLDEDFIDRLERYQHSKGRPAEVFFYNIPSDRNGIESKISQDLEALFLFASHRHDYIIVRDELSPAFKKELQKLPFDIADTYAINSTEQVKMNRVSRLQVSEPQSDSVREKISNRFGFTYQENPNQKPPLSSDDKYQVFEIIENHDSKIISSLKDFKEQVDCFGDQKLILKGRIARSGQGHLRLEGQEDDQIKKHIDRFQGAVLEPLHDRVADLSLLFNTEREQMITGIVSSICQRSGRYSGHWVSSNLFQHLNNDTRTDIYRSLGNTFIQEWRNQSKHILQKIISLGYKGRGSIDAYIYRDQNGLKFRPICEINFRWTMGHFAWELRKRLNVSRGVWLMFNKQDLKTGSLRSFEELYTALGQDFQNVWPCGDFARSQITLPLFISDDDLVAKIKRHPVLSRKCFSLST